MPHVLYVYAIARAGHPTPDDVDVEALDTDGLSMFYAKVDAVEFSQGVIDARSMSFYPVCTLETRWTSHE